MLTAGDELDAIVVETGQFTPRPYSTDITAAMGLAREAGRRWRARWVFTELDEGWRAGICEQGVLTYEAEAPTLETAICFVVIARAAPFARQ